MDWYIFLTPLLLLPILFLFRLVGCTQDFDQFEGDGRDYGDEGDDGPDRLPTYNFTAPSPSTGEMGVASKDFTVSLPSGQTVPASLTVTPDDGGKGGDFSEQSILLTPGVSPSATFTYTPHSVGKITISTANDHEDEGVKNPPSLTYDSTAPLINITFKLKIVDSIPLIQPNPLYYIWPKFMIGDVEATGYVDGSAPQDVKLEGTAYTPFTIEVGPVQVPVGEHTCSCDVYITRLNIDDDPNDPIWDLAHHLIGPETALQTEFQSDIVLTFILSYQPATSPPIDYRANDFLLTPPPIP